MFLARLAGGDEGHLRAGRISNRFQDRFCLDAKDPVRGATSFARRLTERGCGEAFSVAVIAQPPPGRAVTEESTMGLLDTVLGSLMGGNAGASSPMGNILSSMLGGGQQGGMANQGTSPGLGGVAGGLGGLLSQFEQAGLGSVAQSWIGNGPNQPVSPQQLQNVFGEDQVQTMANQAGMPSHDFLTQLSQHLPHAVDGMTPNGQLPDEGSVSV